MRIFPISLHKSISTLSLSSLSLSLSQNSNDSSLTDSTISLDQKISLALRLIAPPERRDVQVLAKNVQQHSPSPTGEGMKRCNFCNVSRASACFAIIIYYLLGQQYTSSSTGFQVHIFHSKIFCTTLSVAAFKKTTPYQSIRQERHANN